MSREKTRIRILFLIDAIDTDRAGTEKQLLKLLGLLDRGRYDCFLACFENTPWLESNGPQENRFVVGTTKFRSPAMYVGLWSLVRFLTENRIDIVQAFFPTSITVGVIASRIAGVPVIVSSRRDMGFWKHRSIKVLLKFANMFVDRFLANSEEVRRHIIEDERIPEGKIDVIYNGVEISHRGGEAIDALDFRKRLGIPEDHFVVGTVANLNRTVKRIDLFIDAAFRVLKEKANVSFVIVGDGDLRESLVGQARKLGILENVKFAGSQEDVSAYVSNFDLAVNSSDSEGLSNAVLEYMCLGVPTVATEVGGNREIITNGVNGLLVSPGDAEAAAASILRILNDERLRKRMREAAFRRGQAFSVNEMARAYNAYYENLVGEGGRRN